MNDATGYPQCLIEEYLLLEILDSSKVVDMCMDLQNRSSELGASFPCHLVIIWKCDRLWNLLSTFRHQDG